MQQSENLPGPKVQLQLHIGSLNFFLSPRQFHLLVYVLDFFLNSTNSAVMVPVQHQHNYECDDDECDIRATSDDELRNQVNRMTQMTGGLGLNQGWSPDPIGMRFWFLVGIFPAMNKVCVFFLSSIGSDINPSHVITNQPTMSRQPPATLPQHRRYSESIFSSNSSMTSSMCSSMTQTTHNSSRARKRGIIDADPNADISALDITIGSCAIVLLHNDVLVESSSSTCPLNEDSVRKLTEMANKYFETCMEMSVDKLFHFGKLMHGSTDFKHHLRYALCKDEP